MTPKQALPIGALAIAAIIAGVVMLFGAGWGLLVGGGLVLVATVLLYEPPAEVDGFTQQHVSMAERVRARQAGKPQ